jgi:hypothetical protein
LRAIALQRTGVKTGIQDRENETWIPASAGMTTFWNMFYFYFQSAKLILKVSLRGVKRRSNPEMMKADCHAPVGRSQ